MKPRLLALTKTLLTSISRPQPVRRASSARNSDSGIFVAVEAQIERGVLDQDLAADRVLGDVDVAGDDLQCLSRAREGQQVGEAGLAMARPGEMLGDEERLETVAERLQAGELDAVGLLGTGERQADAVDRQRMSLAQRLEHGQARAAVDHVVLGMDLEPQPFRRTGHRLLEMDRA